MSEPLRPGSYQAEALTWELRESQSSQSIGLEIVWHPTQQLDNKGQWVPCDVCSIRDTVWFIGKDGDPNPFPTDTLKEILGWSGNPDDLENPEKWKPNDAMIVVDIKNNDGRQELRVQWINRPDGSRVSSRKLSDEQRSSLKDRIRATMQGQPSSQPSQPPKPWQPPSTPDDDIPF